MKLLSCRRSSLRAALSLFSVPVVLVAAAVVPPGTWAQTDATPPTAAAAPPADAAPLGLADALRRALESNLDLAVRRVDPRVAEQSIQIAWADFDPVIAADASHTETREEILSVPNDPGTVFEPTAGKLDRASATWSDRLTFGPSYTIGLASSRRDDPNQLIPIRTEPFFLSFNPSYSTGLTANARVPLLRGLGREAATEQVLLAQENLEISREDLAQQIYQTLQAVENAYWDLVGAGQTLDVSRESLGLAQELLDLNRKKVEVGTLAPIEITQAEAGVASREEAVIVAEAARRDAEDRLRAFMAVPRSDPLWDRTIAPTLQPAFDPVPVNVGERIDQALSTRPELVSARRVVRQRELSARVARNTLKPQLDLLASVNPTGNNLEVLPGADGQTGTFDDVIEVRGGGDSFSEVTGFDNYDWSVGAEFSIPLRNRAAKANVAIADLELDRAKLQIASAEQTVAVEVRTAARGVTSGAERVAAARKNVELQEKKLDAERKKFENGMSTSFEVLTFQTDLSNARVQLIQALIEYNKARTELERATGTLLEARGMRLESPPGS